MKKNYTLKSITLSRRSFLKTAGTSLLSFAALPHIFPAGLASAATTAPGGQKVLTIYYSRSGNTRAMAKIINSLMGGDIVELETVQPYPAEYRPTTEQAKKELAENFYPPLKTTVNNLGAYNVVFVGSPSWWGTFAPPVRGFLAQNNFTGKKLVPFITHGGSGLGKSEADLAALCPGAEALGGIAVRGSNANNAQSEITQWLEQIGVRQ